ncbi:hypothetical protein NC653_026383 [Populus alba x Populus x berolinensis]|uniref:Peroxidase n=1 Tax=Populus alba x Populus x berolinensis TaxID=444605 RepID=A0AAD6MDI2_9ROSI|nr:hypothetical protein NC653_026383 [Populus alba x Populus x berolinensis]
MWQVGGPSWAVKLGRRDSTTASPALAITELPAFSDDLGRLISRFQQKGLTARDMVALSGSHSLGQAQCFTFRDRIHSDNNIDAGFASTRKRRCPLVGSDSTLAPLDLVTPNSFDNNYFKNLMQKKGLLQSDQELFSGGSTDSIVSEYSRNPAKFSSDFASAMIKMGDISPLTGSAGQIRRICSAHAKQNSPLHFTTSRVLKQKVGGPSWAVKLGRRDSTTASPALAITELPAFFDDLGKLISRFQKKGLTARDMVALSGSHTLGQAQCFTFRDRIYNASNIDAGFASTRKRRCPRTGGQANLAPLDLVTPNSFDNNYFKNLMRKKGLLQSDQVLFNGGSTDSIVSEYSRNPAKFSSDFASAMIKMGDIRPLTGSAGQIRRICSAVN